MLGGFYLGQFYLGQATGIVDQHRRIALGFTRFLFQRRRAVLLRET